MKALLSSLRDRAAARLASSSINPSRGDSGCSCRWCVYDKVFERRIRWVLPRERAFFRELKEDWEATHHEASRLESMLAGSE